MTKFRLLFLTLALVGCDSKDTKPDPGAASKPAAGSPAAQAADAPADSPAAQAEDAAAAPSSIDRKQTAEFPGNEDGAKQLLSKFLDPATDKQGLTAALRPDPADYAAVFAADVAAAIQADHATLWSSGEAMSGKEGQTELLLSSASTDDFKAWNEKADTFPGGYKKIADKLEPGVVLYRWKFVKPGETSGMAFDGLAHVNGHWAWFPKPWRSVREP